ncbi:hypothetical protein KID03_07275 [bacterium]|nr:hypothetical protein [bacterium]
METKSGLKLSALQMNSVIGNKQANIEKVYTLVSQNLEAGTDVLILPEVWPVGWDCEEFEKSAENIKSSSVIQFLSKLAQKYNIYVIGGSFIRKTDDGELYNSCPVFNRNGELIAIYDKNHLYSYCGCNEGTYIIPGKNGVVVDIDGIKTGLTICYDIRFPEIFREYRKAGAKLIINAAAWGASKPIPWEVLTKARAIENQVYFVALTQCGPIDLANWNIGHSRIINYLGETISEIKNQKEGLMSCYISFETMDEYRKQCPVLNDIKEKYEVKVYEKTVNNNTSSGSGTVRTSQNS